MKQRSSGPQVVMIDIHPEVSSTLSRPDLSCVSDLPCLCSMGLWPGHISPTILALPWVLHSHLGLFKPFPMVDTSLSLPSSRSFNPSDHSFPYRKLKSLQEQGLSLFLERTSTCHHQCTSGQLKEIRPLIYSCPRASLSVCSLTASSTRK